jgi:hypothetical protein
MSYTLGEAAKAVGKSKTTLHRAIKSGKISASKADDGSYVIEPSEPPRVYWRVKLSKDEPHGTRVPQSVGQSGGHGDFERWFQCRMSLLELGAQRAINGYQRQLPHTLRYSPITTANARTLRTES